MENAVDALKLAFGIFAFILALAIAISVIGQARATSDVIFHMNDKTEFYEYVEEGDVNAEDRVVGINTIIPTIHRYAKEQFAVSIYDQKGKPIVRYDLWTEGFMSNWDEILRDKEVYGKTGTNLEAYNQVSERLNTIQRIVNETIQKYPEIYGNRQLYGNGQSTDDKVKDIMNICYSVDASKVNRFIQHGAPWVGDNEQILARIKADMTGGPYENNGIIYNENKKKNLKQYKDEKFIEKFVEITTSGETIITDEGDSLETIKGNKKLEIIYIMMPN